MGEAENEKEYEKYKEEGDREEGNETIPERERGLKKKKVYRVQKRKKDERKEKTIMRKMEIQRKEDEVQMEMK